MRERSEKAAHSTKLAQGLSNKEDKRSIYSTWIVRTQFTSEINKFPNDTCTHCHGLAEREAWKDEENIWNSQQYVTHKRYSSYAEPTHSSRVNEGISSFRVEEGDGEVLGELWLGIIQDGEGERHGGLPTLKCQLLIHREIVGTCSSTRSWEEGEGVRGKRESEEEEGGGQGRERVREREEGKGRKGRGRKGGKGESGRGRRRRMDGTKGGGRGAEGRRVEERRLRDTLTLMVSVHSPVVPLLVLTPTVTLPTVPPARTMVRDLGVPSRAVGKVGLNWKRPAPPSSSMIVTREERLVVERRGEAAVKGVG